MTLKNSSQPKEARLQKLQDFLRTSKISMCVIENPTDLFYLTGLQLSLGALLVTEQDPCLFVDGRYIEKAKKNTWLKAELLDDENISKFFSKADSSELVFDSEHTSYFRYTKLTSLAEKSSIKLVPHRALLRTIRLIKDPEEMSILRESAKLNYIGYQFIKSLLKEGITEKEIADEYEFFCKKKGAERLAFDPIIAFGANSSQPHYRASDAKLKKDDIVLIDIGIVLSHYCSDMTRVVFFGQADKELERILNIAKEAQKAALSLCRPGTKLGELDRKAREVMKKENVESYFLHSLGHGLGLEVHEYPRIKEISEDKDLVLAPGMAITIEPGLYLSGKGGVRYEDTILITENGYENLYPEN